MDIGLIVDGAAVAAEGAATFERKDPMTCGDPMSLDRPILQKEGKAMPRNQTIVALVTIMLAAPAAAQPPAPQLPNYSKTPSELATIAPTGGVGGSGNAKVEVITILGDPSKPGPYSQLLKVAPHATIAAHHHAGDRLGTVLQGTWMFGYGPSFSKPALRTLPVGSVYTEPSGAAHFAMTGDQAVTVLITGSGPTDTVYENPADDPTKKP